MKKIEKYSVNLAKGTKYTLTDKTSEVNAKLYIQAKDDLKIIYVDHALLDDKSKKKCDFMVVGINTNSTHMIELKGKNIEEAFSQISDTIDEFVKDDELKGYVILKEILDAYIVSPDKQKIPNIHSLQEKELAKKLLRGNKQKPKDMFQLIHFVKVIKMQKKVAKNGRQILISGNAPLELD